MISWTAWYDLSLSFPSERQRELQQYLNSLISVSSKIAACPLHKAHTRSTPVIILTLEDYRFGRLTTFIEVFQGGFDIIRHLLSNEQRQPVRDQIAAFLQELTKRSDPVGYKLKLLRYLFVIWYWIFEHCETQLQGETIEPLYIFLISIVWQRGKFISNKEINKCI